LQISNDKTLLAAGGNSIIHVYDINSSDEKPILTYEGHTGNITSIGFQKDLKWLFSCSEDGTVRIWDPRSNTATRTYDCGCAVNTAVLNPNQAEIISGDQNGYVKIWDLEKDLCREEYLPSADLPVRSISIACDASLLAVGSHKGKVFVYAPTATPKIENQTLELIQEFQAHDDYLLKCVISPDVNTIATSSADKSIKLWNTSTWELERTLLQHQRWVWDAVFSADSNYLVTSSSDQSGKLWDLRTGDVIRNYTGHNLTVSCLALCDVVI
jgi:G protein beta subunit-like protein